MPRMTNYMNSDNRPVRVARPQRLQMTFLSASLDQLLPSDHRARVVWGYVESLDLSPLYANIDAVEGEPGRDAVDPAILMALWMFATIEAISSARQLDRLCKRDLAYMWICGDVSVNYHLLSDFRVAHGKFLEQLLTDTIATLMHQGLVTLNVVAQDGMRVRANAGSSSFRREKTLKKCQEEAAMQVERLRNESDDENDASDKRCQSARKRAAQERQDRLDQALVELNILQAQKEKKEKGSGKKARCSSTDPEARKMKMANGGFNPAYNVQFVTDGETRIIIGLDVINSGSDSGQMEPMHQQVVQNYEKAPDHYLVDRPFATHADVSQLEQAGSQVVAPIFDEKGIRKRGKDPFARQRRDTNETFKFRQRMATEEAKELYKSRPSIAEFPNAECRNRGLQQFRVRGLVKAKAQVLWHALTFNLMRMLNLGYLQKLS